MSVADVLQFGAGVLLAIGSLFVLSGGVGMLRFPDFYTRTHAAGLTDSAGAAMLLIGLLLLAPDWQVAVRLLLILLFMLISGPTAAHALAQAARKDGLKVWKAGEDPR